MSTGIQNRAPRARTRGRKWPTVLVGALCLATCLTSGKLTGRAADLDDEDRIAEGRETFRFDTFGDEQLWTDKLRMHEVIEESLDPLSALELGLKVDVDALPDELLAAIHEHAELIDGTENREQETGNRKQGTESAETGMESAAL